MRKKRILILCLSFINSLLLTYCAKHPVSEKSDFIRKKKKISPRQITTPKNNNLRVTKNTTKKVTKNTPRKVIRNTTKKNIKSILWKTHIKNINTPLAIDDGFAYIGSKQGLYALDVKTGKIKWNFKTNAWISSPIVAKTDYGKFVYFSDRYSLYTFNAKTGKILQKFKSTMDKSVKEAFDPNDPDYNSAIKVSILKVNDNIVYFGNYVNSNGFLYALNAKTGKIKWKLKKNLYFWTPIKIYKKFIYGISYDFIYAIDKKTGKIKWKFQANNSVDSLSEFNNNMLYFKSSYGTTYALNAKTGKVIWKTGYHGDYSTSYPPPSVKNKYIYNQGTCNIDALNVKTGKMIWKFNCIDKDLTDVEEFHHNSLVVKGAFAYVGLNDNNFYALNAKTGKMIWKFKTSDRVETKPIITDNKIYFGSEDLHFYALNVTTGRLLWKYKVKCEINSSTINKNIIYLKDECDNIYAIDIVK